jgi:hypothetical protein
MTFRRPADMSFYDWLTQGLNLKTVFVFVGLLIGAHYSQGNRITVVEQRYPTLDKRVDDVQHILDHQRDEIAAKVDRETYEDDQKQRAEQLQAIQDSLGRIETILMEGKQHR